MEKVHEFNRLSSPQCSVVHPSRFVVKLEIHGEDLDVLCTNVSLGDIVYREYNLRKNISSVGSEGAGVSSESLKLKNFFMKSKAS